MKLELIATTTFGLEAVVKREIQNLDYKIKSVEDGKITFWGDERAIVKSNLWLRSADRVLVKMAEFQAFEFEELFQQTKAIPWEEWIPINGEFIVNGTSVKSKLHSVPACQSIVKKAIVDRLMEFYATDALTEDGALYTIKVTILKDRVTLTVDTSGRGLHKRGYRVKDTAAPMKETLAAGLVQLSFFKEGRTMVDTCAGSGTIPIEAAMIVNNVAPGLNRDFISEEWDIISPQLWEEERMLARKAIKKAEDTKIYAIDIDQRAIEAGVENAKAAGVYDSILFKQMDMTNLKTKAENGIFITNPPYGERIGDKKQIDKIYAKFNEFLQEHPTWSLFMITTDKEVESKVLNREADRRRKLYNGRLETCYYQFHGEK